MTANLRGTGGGLRYGYADAVTFSSWTLVGDAFSGFTLTATLSKVIEAYAACDGLSVWLPIGTGTTVWEWDNFALSPVPTTSLSLVLCGMPRMKGAS